MLRKRSASFESLASRLLLTGNTDVEPGPAGENDPITVQISSAVFVIGTAESDTISLDVSGDQYELTVNGSTQQLDPLTVDQVLISGLGSSDQATITTASGADRIELNDDEMEIIGIGYTIRVQQIEAVNVVDSGGDDRVRYYDSAGDDILLLDPAFSAFTNEQGETYTVSGVEVTEAYAEAGGEDQVFFNDSPDDDRFVGKEQFSYMVGNGFSNYARGFEMVAAYSRAGGADEARLHGSDSDDVLVARPNDVQLTVGTTQISAITYPVTRSYGGGGNDQADVFGQDFVTDRFVWEPESPYLYTTGMQDPAADPNDLPANFTPARTSNVFVGFDRIDARGSDDTDRAELMGSSEADTLVGLPQIVHLETPGATVEAEDFRIVRSFGRGGDDKAYLEDSAERDTYVSKRAFVYLEGPDYLNFLADFDEVIVASMNGGPDHALASEYSGPNRDALVFDGPQFLLLLLERNERVTGFATARGDADGADWMATERPSTVLFTIDGNHVLTSIDSRTPEQRAEIDSLAQGDLLEYAILDDDIVVAT